MHDTDNSSPHDVERSNWGGTRIFWKAAVQHVHDTNRQHHYKQELLKTQSSSEMDGTPSIIEERRISQPQDTPVAPKLAVMVHAAHNLPGSNGSRPSGSNGSGGSAPEVKPSLDCYYVRARLVLTKHPLIPLQQQKTAPVREAGGSVTWSDGLLQLEPPKPPEELDLVLQLKLRARIGTGSAIVGSARVPLTEVLQSPQQWGSKQQLPLTGRILQAAGTVLEVQLFMSMSEVPGPLRVLCATWNVGNALPPPPDQLQDWLKGAREGEHHLVAVAAQECNYTKDMRRLVQQHRSLQVSPSREITSAAAAAMVDTADVPETDQARRVFSISEDGDCTPFVSAATSPTGDAATSPAKQQQHISARANIDGELLQHTNRMGSARAVLKAKLLDSVDSAAMWERHISRSLGDKYWLVCSEHMFQTRLLLFARADVVPSINNLSTGFEATGLGHVGVNKGGVGIGLTVGTTHIAFVGTHLAAHQSKTHHRNRDVAEICQELDISASAAARGADLVTGFHHVLWMGDLNYRLEYGQQAVSHSDSPTPEDFASLCAAISEKRFAELLQSDQLQRERTGGHVFHGFAEGPITFAPTFKVDKGEAGFRYNPRRSPAWCDRVLCKSVLPHKQAVCSSYFAVPDICTSDHKPVAAVFDLPLATSSAVGNRGSPAASSRSYAARLASPFQAASPAGSSMSKQSTTWGSAAAAKLARLRSRRNPAVQEGTLYKLLLSSVCLEDSAAWDQLVLLAEKSKNGGHHVTSSSGGMAPVSLDPSVGTRTGFSTGSGSQPTGISSTGRTCSNKSKRRRLKLQLVISGSCVARPRREHTIRLNTDAVDTATAAEQQPSLLLHEDSFHLLPGGLTQLADEWLLVRLVLVEGWGRKQTLARGILPLQPVVAGYRCSYNAAEVSLQLESSSAAVGGLLCTVQLISNASIRASMHEAIKRMRALASASQTERMTSDSSTPAAGSMQAANSIPTDGHGVQIP